jgi:hypothetical protein
VVPKSSRGDESWRGKRAIMKKRSKRLLVVGFVSALLSMLLWPLLFARADFAYKLNRTVQKVHVRLAALCGQKPRPVSLSGKLVGSGAFVESLKGAEVAAVESTSGYAATTDEHGRFIMPHLIWFPGARYTLIITVDAHNVRRVIISAPATYPTGGVIDAGELLLEAEREIPFAKSPIRHMNHDALNANYYKDLFERLTATAETDNEKIASVCRYVATRRNFYENPWSFRSARQILERGAPHCSNLAFAMAAIIAAGGYPTRTTHTSDTPEFIRTHVAVEVYYDDAWHLYDPTYGISFLGRSGGVAGYKELRLDPQLITEKAFRGIEPIVVKEAMEWMPNAYGSGLHQFYYINEDVFFGGA